MSLVLTKAAAALKRAPEVQHIKFEAHKPKRRKPEPEPRTGPMPVPLNIKSHEVDLKKIRHEVVKFGMSGFDAPKKEEARIALAVSLGAKPPKREYKNYKELMVQRKEEKRKDRERKQMLEKDMLRGSVPGGKKKKNSNDVGHLLNVYGKVDKKKIKEREQKDNTNKNKKIQQPKKNKVMFNRK